MNRRSVASGLIATKAKRKTAAGGDAMKRVLRGPR